MRILLDEARLDWGTAWDLTRRTLAYTNDTLLPEALEKWPRAWLEVLLPRQLEIVLEIDRRLLEEVRARFPGDEARVQRVSLIDEGDGGHVRMANLAIVGSHRTNGVAVSPASSRRCATCCSRATTTWTSYLEADDRLIRLYADPPAWTARTIRDVAASGKFSSDRTIAEYASGTWGVDPRPVPRAGERAREARRPPLSVSEAHRHMSVAQ